MQARVEMKDIMTACSIRMNVGAGRQNSFMMVEQTKPGRDDGGSSVTHK